MRQVDRREFTVGAALLLLGLPTITLSACGGGGGSNPMSPTPPAPNPTPTPSSGDVQGVISANHGHIAIITKAELDAGGALNLTFTGTADHTHSVSLSANEIVSIRGGGRVSKVSTTTQSHDHTVTFN